MRGQTAPGMTIGRRRPPGAIAKTDDHTRQMRGCLHRAQDPCTASVGSHGDENSQPRSTTGPPETARRRPAVPPRHPTNRKFSVLPRQGPSVPRGNPSGDTEVRGPLLEQNKSAELKMNRRLRRMGKQLDSRSHAEEVISLRWRRPREATEGFRTNRGSTSFSSLCVQQIVEPLKAAG